MRFLTLQELTLKLSGFDRPGVPSLRAALDEIQGLGPRMDRYTVISNCLVEVEVFDGALWLKSIYALQPGQGDAAKATKRILEVLDKHGVTAKLNPKPFGREKRLTKAQLVAWYKRLGFEKAPGDVMVRKPPVRQVQNESEHVPFGSKPFQAYRHYDFQPGKVYDGGIVQRYIFSMQSPEDFEEGERIADYYELKEMDPKALEDESLVTRDDDNPGVEADYAELKTPFPPIVLDDNGAIIDGNHRLIAAIIRGDGSIKVLVPCKPRRSGSSMNEAAADHWVTKQAGDKWLGFSMERGDFFTSDSEQALQDRIQRADDFHQRYAIFDTLPRRRRRRETSGERVMRQKSDRETYEQWMNFRKLWGSDERLDKAETSWFLSGIVKGYRRKRTGKVQESSETEEEQPNTYKGAKLYNRTWDLPVDRPATKWSANVPDGWLLMTLPLQEKRGIMDRDRPDPPSGVKIIHDGNLVQSLSFHDYDVVNYPHAIVAFKDMDHADEAYKYLLKLVDHINNSKKPLTDPAAYARMVDKDRPGKRDKRPEKEKLSDVEPMLRNMFRQMVRPGD